MATTEEPKKRADGRAGAGPAAPPPAESGSILGLSDVPPPTTPKALVAAPAPAEEPVERTFEVLEDREVPRGASTFLLKKGQKIREGGYDIKWLESIGVKLREVKVPPKPKAVEPAVVPAVAAAPATPAPDVPEDFYEVLETADVPRPNGMMTYELKKGQRISQGGYDIKFLEEHGVQLKKLAPVVKPAPASP